MVGSIVLLPGRGLSDRRRLTWRVVVRRRSRIVVCRLRLWKVWMVAEMRRRAVVICCGGLESMHRCCRKMDGMIGMLVVVWAQ